MREQVHSVLESMRLSNGLYLASLSQAYRYVWVRDTCYVALSHLSANDEKFATTMQAMLDIFRRYRWKIEYHTGHRPIAEYEYIHPRYSADTFEEVHEPWGNAQNDAIGLFLFAIGQGLRAGVPVLRDAEDRTIVQLLAHYLGTLGYWTDSDNGMWEENREIHASSIGACVAGLLAIQPYFRVDWPWISRGLQHLFGLLPSESASKACDLAQLSLIYPYQLLPLDLARYVVRKIEECLLRDRGVIRYQGDRYYSEGNQEAEWCMGLPWLGLCHLVLGDPRKGREYLRWTEAVMPKPGVIPELYLPKSRTPNGNTPLAWAQAMYVLLYDELARAGAL